MPRDYYLVTLHRQENVDNPERLTKIVKALESLDKKVLWPVHPRTRKHLDTRLETVDPMGFLDFIHYERNAFCVLTDSGTVQEECAIFGVPCVTVRDSTERPETIESGSNIVVGCETEAILRGVDVATSLRPGSYPEEYSYSDVSNRVVRIVCSAL